MVVVARLAHATSRHSNLLDNWIFDRRLLSAMSFVNETRAHVGGVRGACSKEAYQHVEKLARLLSEDLMHTSRHYSQHSFGGIFANGGSNKFDNHQVKSRFIFDRVCGKQTQIKQVCEVGFMAGHKQRSSHLILAASVWCRGCKRKTSASGRRTASAGWAWSRGHRCIRCRHGTENTLTSSATSSSSMAARRHRSGRPTLPTLPGCRTRTRSSSSTR